jgi:hypothetical protein
MKISYILPLLISFGCNVREEPISNEQKVEDKKFILTSPITGKNIEIAEFDIPVMLDWFNANKSCQDLGEGWRLPHLRELEIMRKELHLKNKGNFSDIAAYWSGTERDGNWAWFYNIRNGINGVNPKVNGLYVRAVKDL